MNDKTKAPLARWWWPGQWLHIVYGVWIDQLWYWQNVRPHLHGRKLGWGLYTQGLLGAAIIGLIAIAILGGIISATGIQIAWNKLILGVVGISLGSAVIGTIHVILNNDIPANVARIIAFYTIAMPVVSLALGVNFINFHAASALWGALWGIALSVGAGLAKGVVSWRDRDLFLSGVLIIILSLYMKADLIIGVIMFVALILGFYSGGRWVIRQIQDPETRKRLADPYIPQGSNGGQL